MGFVDCDAHLIESEATWSYLDPTEAFYRPTLVDVPAGHRGSRRRSQIWLFGDTWCTNLGSRSDFSGSGNKFEPESTHLLDPRTRVQDLDALGIDTQLLFSSVFLTIEIDNPFAEAALCRSYNRWAADITSGYSDRLKWAAQLPLRSPGRACEELEFAANNGAATVQVRGVAHGYFLSDPSFRPIWRRAEELGLAIAVHVGVAARDRVNQPIGRAQPSPPWFIGHMYPLMVGFHDVITSDLTVDLPGLRWGFLEGGATWVPAVLQQHARLAASGEQLLDLHPMTPEKLEAMQVFVACEADEDIAYLASVVGENVLCTGSDYAHNDVGSELAAHATILQRRDLPEAVARKIVDTNGRKFLGLSPGSTSELLSAIPEVLPHVRSRNTGEGSPFMTSLKVRS
jgi:uncharacterized protein